MFSLVPSDNRDTRSTCPTSVFTGTGRLKTKLYDKIFQQHLRIMLTFQDSYVVRGLALSTMFF
jgi:hypothetical protein